MTAISIDSAMSRKTSARLKIGIVIDLVLFALIILIFNIGIPSFYLISLYVLASAIIVLTAVWVDSA